MISRKLLLRKLELVASAVAAHDLVPILTHVCFTGDFLLACNDKIGIVVPLQTEFQGTIPAKMLIDMLRIARHAAVVNLQADGTGAVLVSLGSMRLKLETWPREKFPLRVPALPRKNCIKGNSAKFFAAVEHCMRSVPRHCSECNQLGITLIPDGGTVSLFSTDKQTLSHAKVQLPEVTRFKHCVILPAEFCRQMLRLAKAAQTTRFALHADHAIFAADDTVLFGGLIQSNQSLDFEGTLKRYLPRGYRKAMVRIRKRQMGPILARASCITDIIGSEKPSRISINGGEATFCSRSKRGLVIDSMALPGHREVESEVRVSLLLKAYASLDNVLFTPECAIMARDDMLYLVLPHIDTERRQCNGTDAGDRCRRKQQIARCP